MENENNVSIKNILPGFIFVLFLAFGFYKLIQFSMPIGAENSYLKPSADILTGVVEGNFIDRLYWSIMDWTQGSFLGLLPSSLGMLVFSFVGAFLERKKSKYMGTGIDGIGFIFSKIAMASFIGSLLNLFVWSDLLSNGWSVSFAPFLTIVSYMMFYGVSLSKVITIIIVSVILAFPLSHYSMVYITTPLGLPAYVAVAIGLVVMVGITYVLFKFMPWMHTEEDSSAYIEEDTSEEVTDESGSKSDNMVNETKKNTVILKESIFFVHRVFGDFGELNFWGSSYAGMAMVIGGVISVILNQNHGAPNLDVLILCQLITAALSVLVYYKEWKQNGWAYTFGSILLTSAIVATYPNTPQILIPTIIVAAVLCPWAIRKVVEITRLGEKVPAIFFTLVGVL